MGVLRLSLGREAQFAHRQGDRVQTHPVAGKGREGRRLLLALHHIGGSQQVLVGQAQLAGMAQQAVGLAAEGRDHRHHAAALTHMAVDFRRRVRRVLRAVQHRAAELQHHHLATARQKGRRLRFELVFGFQKDGDGHGVDLGNAKTRLGRPGRVVG